MLEGRLVAGSLEAGRAIAALRAVRLALAGSSVFKESRGPSLSGPDGDR